MAKGKILIIEDDVTLAKMYSREFQAKDYEVAISYDGVDGLKKVAAEKPSLILLELDLPKMDGTVLFQKIRFQDETAQTPVILLINAGQEKAIFDCFKLGRVDYIVKSDLPPAEVVSKAGKFLQEE